mmetsp:Transcript_15153/g.25962  ORF Transcript_15153/g.25962 Transcript_15153/m.25962 type:complete len:588 (-) Transcript_15153:723-2486(-)|eukprot:CAMPEP_0196658838 /NCGR_PEP_ID=MMETSP1086-20130531/31855_1 /TAXON_ID=77921 /ORGANISM="Cyanoptyche  gloeocystis , Strain SAG4.97" /LENGTH=587 /DNA_ID=CAMNT_0041992595 /DNA_START=122 /DNA_END=1885 /DNA_ORIENTATION=-
MQEISITGFWSAKVVFLTGASGFIGKTLLEKLLREVPSIKRIYILIRTNAGKTAETRLRHEFVENDLFHQLRQWHGASFETFFFDKVIPVSGDLSLPDLGISGEMLTRLKEEVHVILNLAGDVNFRLPIDKALKINTLSGLEIAKIALGCSQLEVLLHTSTCYVHGRCRGSRNESLLSWDSCLERFEKESDKSLSFCPPDVVHWLRTPSVSSDAETLWVLEVTRKAEELAKTKASDPQALERMLRYLLREIGLHRARSYGFHDVYTYSKAMGEIGLVSVAKEHKLPLVIVRPAIVCGISSGPNRGWIEGTTGIAPVVMGYLQGDIDGFGLDGEKLFDLIPCDHVMHATLAAAVHRSQCPRNAETQVYQVASSVQNPFYFLDFSTTVGTFARLAYPEKGLPAFHLYPSREGFVEALRKRYPSKITRTHKIACFLSSHLKGLITRQYTSYRKYEFISQLFESYVRLECSYDASGTLELQAALSPIERERFGFDVRSIDWTEYMVGAVFSGIARHLMHDKCIEIKPSGLNFEPSSSLSYVKRKPEGGEAESQKLAKRIFMMKAISVPVACVLVPIFFSVVNAGLRLQGYV